MSAAAPSLTFLLLCWNHGPYLEQCIASIAAQERHGVEILLLDNASSDGSFELAERLFTSHGLSATMLRNPAPQGISANFNRLLAAATGELVAVLATDDWYEPGYVAAMRQAAIGDPEAGWFTCGGHYYFEDSGKRVPVADATFAGGMVLPRLLANEEPFFFVGCCYRRTALEAVGGWDEALPIEDRDLFVRLAQYYPVRVLPERLVNYRRAVTNASANPEFMSQGFDAFFAKHRTLFGRAWRRRYAAALQGPASIAVDQGKLDLARRLLRRSLALDPVNRTTWRTTVYWLRRRIG